MTDMEKAKFTAAVAGLGQLLRRGAEPHGPGRRGTAK